MVVCSFFIMVMTDLGNITVVIVKMLVLGAKVTLLADTRVSFFSFEYTACMNQIAIWFFMSFHFTFV